MDAETISNINSLVQLSLATTALWYTIETRKLRRESEKQARTIEGQKRLSVAPYLVVGVLPSKQSLKKIVDDTQEIDQEQKTKFLSMLGEAQQQDLIIHVAKVSNPTDKIAIDLYIYIYDNNKKSFLAADTSQQVLSPKGDEFITISKPYMTHDEVLDDIESKYNLKRQFEEAEKEIDKDWSAIYLLYRDLEGYPYLIARPFRIDEDGDTSFRRQLFYFNNATQI